ncbi:tyrosine-type recombinase/integrase [Tautonia sp. JC769]|uniref:tyrosine-type recombinase/integrase n=1 Tax=Tautonia sp. JC769 TaxID=3232135 RepID=UPI0034586445
MPRKRPQPFYRRQTRCWYVQLGAKQHRLAPDEAEAWRLYHELMARPPEERAAPPAPAADAPPTLAVAILDAFLEWCKQHKAPRTYAWYRENIQRFVDRIPATLAVAELKPYHVTRAMADFPHWANNTKNDFIGAIKRAFNWAADEELIERSPLARMKKPAREAREMAVSPKQYAAVVEAVREPNFRDLIELSWETGARPQELRRLEARFYDPEAGRVVFPPTQAKGKKYHRVIYLTPRAREVVERLAAKRPHGPLLVNSEGNPWTKDAINCAFCRLEKKIGTKYHLGAFRKGFATEALKAGVDTVTVAHLMGHRDPGMVSRVYGHVQQDPEHMAAAARRARPGGEREGEGS